MFRIRILSLLLATALAVVAGVATSQALERQTTAPPALSPVVMVARSLPVGARVVATDLRVVGFPPEAIPEWALRDIAAAAGRYVVVPTVAGELLIGSKLSDTPPGSTLATVIPQGHRAVSVAVQDLINTTGLISPGDRVDVLGIMNREPDDLAEVVLRDVLVLAVADTIIGTPSDGSRAPAKAGGAGTRSVTVTLAVTEDQARRLVQVDDLGRLRLAMRPRVDSASPPLARE